MNKAAALTILGLSGDEDRTGVTQIYGERLTSVQEQLVSAQTEVERDAHGAKLAELSEAYELVTNTGRYATANEAAGATVLRSLPAFDDVSVRMEPGAVIADRLEIGALLGEGGMGSVYAARDRLKGEDVAIKVLRRDLQFSAAAKDRFLAEAKVSCNLSHPNIVRVHDVGLIGGTYYLSMERLKGHTLRQQMDQYRREKRPFRIAEVTDIARQLIDALRYANRYIIHRDIKPENIWLAEDGTVKLMDFGIARAFSNSQMTQTGMMLGTAYYMSPEQRADSKNLDWRTDQYALGVVLYEMLTGALPTGAVRPIDEVRRDLPTRFADALMRSMATLPKKRFKSFDDMLEEIQAPKPFRLARLVVLAATFVIAFASWSNPGWIFKVPAIGMAIKAEFAAASARIAGHLEPAPPGKGGGSGFVGPPRPEETPTASISPKLEFVQESMPEPESAESQPVELQPAASESAALEQAALEQAAAEAGASPQIPEQTNADATLPSEASPQAETSETTQSSIDTRRDECIAQCERDACVAEDEQCLTKLRDCRAACE